MRTVWQSHFANTASVPSEKSSRKTAKCGLSRDVTENEFRGWVRQWIADLSKKYKSQREFARETGIKATDVNNVVKGKRPPTWMHIERITTALSIPASVFLLDLVQREHAERIAAATSSPTPSIEGPVREPVPEIHLNERAKSLADSRQLRGEVGGEQNPQSSAPRAAPQRRQPKKRG